MTGKLIVISGPSGCGKGTVIKKLSDLTPFVLSISDTTRAIRDGETAGVNYNYLSNEEFLQKAEAGELLEYASYAGRAGLVTYYGTPKARVLKSLREGKNVILEIEVQGAMQVKEKMPEAVLIFILPPSREVLEARLTGRGTEKPEDIKKRLITAESEMKEAPNFDYRVINDNLNECVMQIKDIIEDNRR